VATFRFGRDERYLVVSYAAEVDEMFAILTAAERRVVGEVLAGRSNRDIALARGVSVNTVANQIASAFRKLGVRSRAELAALCATRSSS
jgi:DNA-binding CsgD family transcriptional regulator